MRLLVCGPGHPFRGGIARTTTELVRALEARGHEVVLLTPVRQYPGWLFPGADDRDPLACPRLDCADPCLDPLNPLSWTAMRRRALAAEAELWIIPYWTWAWAGCWYALLRGEHPPAVAVVHNPADHDAGLLPRLAARLVLERCRGLFTHAETLAEDLRRHYPGVPVAASTLPALPLGGMPGRAAARRRLGLAEGARVALFFGLIRPYKGVDLLLEAFSRLPASLGWHLLVCGEPWGDLGSSLRRHVAALGIGDRVELQLRWLAEEEMAAVLAAADVVVLPYRSGTQSAVAPLALAHGLPVVSSTVGGLAEVVQHGVNGLLVSPGSVEELQGALLRLDDQLLERLAIGARGSSSHSWSAYAGALEGLLEVVRMTP